MKFESPSAWPLKASKGACSPTRACHTSGNASLPRRPGRVSFKTMARPLPVSMSPQEQSRDSGTPPGALRVPRFWKPGLTSRGRRVAVPQMARPLALRGKGQPRARGFGQRGPAWWGVTARPCPGPLPESPPLARGSRASTRRQPGHEVGLPRPCHAPGDVTPFVPRQPSVGLIWSSAFGEPRDAVFPESDFPG